MAKKVPITIGKAYDQYLGHGPSDEAAQYWTGKGEGAVRGIKNSIEADIYRDKMATTSGQMEEILSKDSPLMKQAATQGKQASNQRGLLNSSMGVGASQDAMIRSALPIASQDAGYGQALGKMEKQNEYTRGLADQQYGFNKGLSNQQYRQNRGLADQSNEITKQQMNLGSKLDLKKLGASASANAWGVMSNNITDIVAQGMEGIANIQANPNIKPADKTKMISQITSMRNSDINFQKGLYTNMSSYLNKSGIFPRL